jgi:DNA-binding response OmpR family regulator
MRVLVVEDESEIAAAVASALRQAGFVVDVVGTLDEVGACLQVVRYGLLLLDRRLPDGDGITLIPAIRRAQPGVPILILSALDQISDKVAGLDKGADDYLAKPFDRDELMARVRAALRRPGGDDTPPITCGKLSFDARSRNVFVEALPVMMKRRELALLEALIRRVGRVVQKDTLVEEVYGFDDDIQSNTLEAHVSRLRSRLASCRAGVVIHTVRGVGYCLDVE